MTTPVFGYTPTRRDIRLSTGADFILNLVLQGGVEWPEGTGIHIKIGPFTWAAEIYDNVARWKVESEATDTVSEGTPYQMYVSYPPHTPGGERDDYMWFYGKVRRTRSS